MYYLQDTILKIKLWKGDKDRHKTMEKLLWKLRSRVYHWDLNKTTYRNVYHATETNDFNYINKVLEYETWYKIIKQ